VNEALRAVGARGGQYALVVWAAATLNFALPHLAPGDPVEHLRRRRARPVPGGRPAGPGRIRPGPPGARAVRRVLGGAGPRRLRGLGTAQPPGDGRAVGVPTLDGRPRRLLDAARAPARRRAGGMGGLVPGPAAGRGGGRRGAGPGLHARVLDRDDPHRGVRRGPGLVTVLRRGHDRQCRCGAAGRDRVPDGAPHRNAHARNARRLLPAHQGGDGAGASRAAPDDRDRSVRRAGPRHPDRRHRHRHVGGGGPRVARPGAVVARARPHPGAAGDGCRPVARGAAPRPRSPPAPSASTASTSPRARPSRCAGCAAHTHEVALGPYPGGQAEYLRVTWREISTDGTIKPQIFPPDEGVPVHFWARPGRGEGMDAGVPPPDRNIVLRAGPGRRVDRHTGAPGASPTGVRASPWTPGR
jgi:hypothetical protein